MLAFVVFALYILRSTILKLVCSTTFVLLNIQVPSFLLFSLFLLESFYYLCLCSDIWVLVWCAWVVLSPILS